MIWFPLRKCSMGWERYIYHGGRKGAEAAKLKTEGLVRCEKGC